MSVAPAPPPPFSRERSRSRPFTVAHFQRWAAGLVLDTGEPWEVEPFQQAFLRDHFAGVAEAWLVVPEGNAKTTLVAGLALYHCQHRRGAWVPVAASARDQAEILFRQAEGLVARSELPGWRCLEGYRRIRFDAMGSRIQIFAADDRTGDGVIPTLCVLDELHRHKDLRLYRTWRGKLGKRGGQIVAISTAGEPGSEFEVTRERIRQESPDVSRRGSFVRAAGPALVLHEWAVPEDADVEDVRVVKRANPLRAVTLSALREKRESPTMTLAHWRRFVCNLPTRGVSAAITEAEWAAQRTEARIPEGEPIWAGLDVAWKWDTTALVPLWWRDEEYRLFGPATVLEPPRDGSSLDPHLVERALVATHERNPVEAVVMDTSRAEQLATWIEEELGCVVVDRAQTNSFAVEDFDRFMEALRLGWLWHAGDEGLTRHALAAVARVLPWGDARFDRPAPGRMGSEAPRRCVDALTAAAMVHSVAAANQGRAVAAPWVAAW